MRIRGLWEAWSQPLKSSNQPISNSQILTSSNFQIFCGRPNIAPHPRHFGPFHGTPLQRLRQLVVSQRRQGRDARAVPDRARLPGAVVRNRRREVPGAYLLADVAAVDVRAE